MKEELAKKAKNLTIWIIFLSIIGLFLLSFLPWISVAENDSVKENLYFNFEMMKKSDNEQINELAGDINLISISFWALIIFGLLSFLGANIYASGKIPIVGHLLLIIGCGTLISSILVVDIQLIILKNIAEMKNISAAAIISPIDYTYISLIPGFLIFIISILYTWPVVTYSIDKFKTSKRGKNSKKEEKKISKKSSKKKEKIITKKPLEESKPVLENKAMQSETHEKRITMEQWLTRQVKDMEKKADNKKNIKREEKKPLKHPFPEKKDSGGEEKSKKSDEIPTSQPLKEALSSAIEKKQTEIKEQKPSKNEAKSEIEEKSEKKKYKVRCPQCLHIFPIEKEGAITRIKCPKCGKEGFVR